MSQIIMEVQGGAADHHEIPAYMGSQSIYGISRSILIVTNVLAEGKLRKKDFDFNKCQINIAPPRAGRFIIEFIVTYPIAATVAAAGATIAGGVAGNLVYDILKYSYMRLTGQKVEEKPHIEAALTAANASEERLLEAIEPSARIAHSLINNGVINININSTSDKNNVELNSDTKKFIWGQVIDRSIRTKLFSVSRFDPNSRIGTLFDFEEKRPLSFQIEKDIDEQSVESIIWSQSEYTRKRILNKEVDSKVAFKYTSLNAHDGRAKKIFVGKVRRNMVDL